MAKNALDRPTAPSRTSVLPAAGKPMAGGPTRCRGRSVSALLLGATALGGAMFLPGLADAAPTADSHCTASAGTTTCTYTAADGNIDFTAPTGVSTFSVTASGAAGGNGGDNPSGRVGGIGGAGTQLTKQITVGADRTYNLTVGAKGGNGGTGGSANAAGNGGTGSAPGGRGGDSFFGGEGGGGGGATSISQSNSASVVLVAGGGGGGAGGARDFDGGTGQPATSTTTGSGGGIGEGAFFDGAGGGGGGGLRGGAGGTGGDNRPGAGGFAGTSSSAGTTGSVGDGSLVITYATPTTPPTATGPRAGRTDLFVTLTAPRSVAAGQTETITATVTNRGAETATDVRTAVSLPSGLRPATPTTFRQAALAPGQSQTYTITAQALRASKNVIQANTASRTPDAFLRDNFAKTTTTVTPATTR